MKRRGHGSSDQGRGFEAASSAGVSHSFLFLFFAILVVKVPDERVYLVKKPRWPHSAGKMKDSVISSLKSGPGGKGNDQKLSSHHSSCNRRRLILLEETDMLFSHSKWSGCSLKGEAATPSGLWPSLYSRSSVPSHWAVLSVGPETMESVAWRICLPLTRSMTTHQTEIHHSRALLTESHLLTLIWSSALSSPQCEALLYLRTWLSDAGSSFLLIYFLLRMLSGHLIKAFPKIGNAKWFKDT